MIRITRHRLTICLLALALVAGLAMPQHAQAQDFPKLTGRVVDAANLLDPAQESQIEARLAGLEQQSGRQVVVATLPDLQGYDIADFGYRLGRAWGIGSKEHDDGALLIVAPKERKVRIEVGYGLEGIVTDALSFRIIRNSIVPRFKANDYPGGIAAGTDELVKLLSLPPEEARKLAQQAEQDRQKSQGPDIGTIIFILFFLMFFVLPMFTRRFGRGHRSGMAPTILWGPSIGSGWGHGSGWSSGGGGGGFSGGGGSFGGGGASGSW